jgi:hypothetical protein
MRQAQQQASDAYNTASGTSAGYGSAGSQIASNLVPGLEREANKPQGYTPEEMNNQLVAGEQGAGGANAGIAGQANLQAARSRNSSAQSADLDSAARTKTQQLSTNALNVQNKSANLGEEKQQAAQKELGGLYGTDTEANLKAQGLMPEDVEAETKAGQSGWFQNMTSLIAALGKGAQGAGSVMSGMNS